MDERKLVPNRLVEQCAKRWKEMKNSLLETLLENESLRKSSTAHNSEEGIGRVEKDQKSTQSLGEQSQRKKRPRRTATRRSSGKTNDINTSSCEESDDDEGDDDDEYKDDSVHPVKKKKTQSQPTSIKTNAKSVRLRPKALTNYYKMKRKDLESLCARENLSIQGKDAELIKRHRAFITFYNAECDALNPRTHEQLVKIFQEREKERKKEQMMMTQSGVNAHSTYINKLVKSSHEIPLRIKSGSSDESMKKGTSGNNDFDRQIKENFKKLIAEARMKAPKRKVNSKGVKPDLSDDKDNPGNDDERHKVSSPKTLSRSTMNPSNACEGINIGEQNIQRTNVTMSPENSSSTSSTLSSTASPLPSSEFSPRKHTPVRKQTPLKNQFTHPPISNQTRAQNFSTTGPWICPKCTYNNIVYTWSNAKCQICREKRPVHQSSMSQKKDVLVIDV